MREDIPGQGRTSKQYADSMKIIFISILCLIVSLVFLSCTKQKDYTVTNIITVKESRIDSTYIEREYLIELECL